MTTAVLIAMGAAITAFITPLVTLLISYRKMSGSVASSEAGALWDSAGQFRADLLERIKILNARQLELEERIAALELANHNLTIENESLRIQLGRVSNA